MDLVSRRWRSLSLGSKLTGLTSLLVLVVIAALTYMTIQRERANFRQALENQADLLLDTLPLTMRDQLYRQELDELVEIAKVVSNDPNISLFIIYNNAGVVLVDASEAEPTFSQAVDSLGKMLVESDPNQIYMNWEDEQLIAGRPVVLGNQPTGAVAIGLSTAPLDQKITDLTRQSVLLAFATMVLGAVLAFVIARQITNPLSDLTDVAAKMTGGELSTRVEMQRNDEIGQLGDAFNQMAQAIQRRETELRNLAEHLEILVEERTAELADANSHLKEEIAERVRAEETLQLANERLSIIRQVDDELSQQLDVAYVSTVALDAAIRLSTATAGFIGVTEIDGDGLRVIQAVGTYPEAFAGSRLSPDVGIVSRVIRQRQAEIVADVAADPDYHAMIPQTRALMVFPLVSHRRFVGILNLETHAPESFTPNTFEFLKLLTARISVAIDNAHMFEERAQLVQELETFAHTVAHDLKNPLGGVLGYTSLLLDKLDTTSKDYIQRYLQAIERSGTKMKNIIEALLMLAGVRAADEVELSPLDMGYIIAEVQHRLDFMVQEYRAEMIVPDFDTWPGAMGYTPWVEQVWINYLSNALKYGGRPPCVELGATAEADGEMIRFWVRDNGPGLAPEDQAKLFTPFTRVSEAQVEGHGLGLSIVQRIVEKFGGAVGVESTPGQGSTFFFTLPAESSHQTEARAENK
jgi:signal transduction histidine kinase